MKTAATRSSVIVFSVTMSLVLALAFGVYASNRLLTQWLLVRNIEQTAAQVPSAIASAGMERDLLPRAEASNIPEAGLRLKTHGAVETGGQQVVAAPQAQMSEGLLSFVTATLQPSQVLSNRYVSVSEAAQGPKFVRALAKAMHFEGETGPTRAQVEVLGDLLDRLPDETIPFTHVRLTWWGDLGKQSTLILPQIRDNAVKGAWVLRLDNSSRIESLSVITLVSSVIIAALCLASFLFSAFLLYMRFHDQVKTNRDIEFLAHHDALTGLPNRAVFNARLNEALRLAQAKASNMGVMLIDVDKFKEINDTYGHGTGDIFLQVIADRLRSVFGDHLVARLSGDEFAVMTKSVSDVARLTKLASDMLAATDAPCVIDGKEIKISLSIGVARASDGSWRASRLLHCADLALYRAKHSGRSTFAWYTPDMDADAIKRKEIEAGLVKALKFDQFELLFQPQYSLTNNTLKGYEALIRWEHPTKGSISPDVFIPVAEDCGLIEDIGDWVLMRACQEAAGWEETSHCIAVNVSAAQFMAGETYKKVAHALEVSGLDPTRLEIEITESLLISNTEAVVDTLQRIRGLGVSIAMDDFGTGYSSLSYLSLFPFDKIKIDRTFIQNLGHDVSTDAIVTSIIGLGRSLDVVITAEGVENEEQVILLRAAGCDLVQGFLFGRPGSIADHAGFMERNDPWNAVAKSTTAAKEADEDAGMLAAMAAEDAVEAAEEQGPPAAPISAAG
jgi:diguanylate cyclase (GGDEF)-like protein